MSYRKHVYDPPATPILRADALDDDLQQETPGTPAMQYPLRWNDKEQHLEGGPIYPSHGAIIPPEQNFGQAGYVVAMCGHRMAGSEWLAGLRNCERCGG